jgi:hypothetical protein
MFKKSVSLIVISAFLSLLTWTAYPLHAQQERPGAVETAGITGHASNSGSALPYILIGVGVVAVALVLILVVFKTTYDITGDWDLTFVWNGSSPGTAVITFTGTTSSGTFVEDDDSANPAGTYTVDGKTVSWTWDNSFQTHYTGTFSDKSTMSGTIATNTNATAGTWTATKVSATAGNHHRTARIPTSGTNGGGHTTT